MKKVLAVFLSIIVTLSITACNKKTDESGWNNSISEPTQSADNGAEDITGSSDAITQNQDITATPTVSAAAGDEITATPIVTQAAAQNDISSAPSASGIDGINEDEINKNTNYVPGFTILKDQSFWIDLENFGHVCFISASGEGDSGLNSLYLYLADKDSNILYEFPSFYGNEMNFYGMRAVDFRDVNQDGLKDLIVIGEYTTGDGTDGDKASPVAGVYFQQGDSFIDQPDLDADINDSGNNESVDMVAQYLAGKDIQLN